MKLNMTILKLGFCITDWWLVVPQHICKDYKQHKNFINAIQDPEHEIYRQWYYFCSPGVK